MSTGCAAKTGRSCTFATTAGCCSLADFFRFLATFAKGFSIAFRNSQIVRVDKVIQTLKIAAALLSAKAANLFDEKEEY